MAWLPGAKIARAPDGAADGVLVWEGPRGTVRYMLEFKQHLPQQDIQVLARRLEEQVKKAPQGESGGQVATPGSLRAPGAGGVPARSPYRLRRRSGERPSAGPRRARARRRQTPNGDRHGEPWHHERLGESSARRPAHS